MCCSCSLTLILTGFNTLNTKTFFLMHFKFDFRMLQIHGTLEKFVKIQIYGN